MNRNVAKRILLVSIVLITLLLTACSNTDEPETITISQPSGPPIILTGPPIDKNAAAVEYLISGTATKVNVTLSNGTGGTEQYQDVALPKIYSYNSFSNYFLYVSAQNASESGSVKVSIFLKGKLYKTSDSEGAYVIATASGKK